MKTIGQHMRERRMETGMTMKELAERAGVNPTTLGSYERDQACPGAFSLISLSEVLGISIDEYLGLQNGGKR